MKLSSIALVVSDAKKSAKWYMEKLGFEIRSKDGHWVTVSQKGLPVDIHLCEGFCPLEPGNTGFSFISKDVAKEQKALEAKGVKFTQTTKKEDWGTYAMFADPDGNEFWLVRE
jgi:catechol 2,3-dioxygenase-like lactoylglutathione lyase family enzyme